MPRLEGVEVVLVDIEGTICPISFVKETLFPYALSSLPDFLTQNWSSPTLQPYLDAFPPPYRTDPATLQAHIADLTAQDAKLPALKNLQGLVWQKGYETGVYATPLFSDVAPALRKWVAGGKAVVVYSSGSVQAQKLLFRFVKVGGSDGGVGKPRAEDLSGLVSAWFDTLNAGPKVMRESYGRIAKELKIEPRKVLFLSDNVQEVDAALAAGMQSLLVDRPGNAPVSDSDRNRLSVVTSLEEIELGGH